MCCRFLLESEVEDLVARYNAEYSLGEYKSGEIFPSENVLTVTKSNNKTIIMPMKWGFPMYKSKKLIINARTETVDERPMFKSPFEVKRCIIPANSFFEWKTKDNKKNKHKISVNDDKIFSMGGIYNNNSFVILTMDASPKMKTVHNRMPLILKREEEELWINIDTDLYTLKEIVELKREPSYLIEPSESKRDMSFFDI